MGGADYKIIKDALGDKFKIKLKLPWFYSALMKRQRRKTLLKNADKNAAVWQLSEMLNI